MDFLKDNDLHRRSLLGALGALGASAVLPSQAQNAAPQTGTSAATSARRLIDVHHHYNPPAYKAFVDGWAASQNQRAQGGPLGEWTPQKALEILDSNGVATAVLSLTPGGGGWYKQEANVRAKIARDANEYGARLMSDHKGRFGLFAALPMPDVDVTLKEIAYASDKLKVDGFSLFTNFGDNWPGEEQYAPVWEELNRRKAIVYFHPVTANCCDGLVKNVGDTLIEYPYDTGRCVLSLLFGGCFAKYRDIKWIFSHGGGAIPVLSGRIGVLSKARAQAEAQKSAGGGFAPNGVDYELKRLYYETANAFYPPAMSGLLAYVPVSQVLFGTDWPFVTPKDTADGLAKLGLPAEALAMIERGNAAKMIPRLA